MGDESYTISELAKEFDVTTRTIRFYEEKGLISPTREGQRRIYSPSDRVRIKLILRGKRIGMTLQESVDVIDMYDPSNNNTGQLQAVLSDLRERRDKLVQQKRDIDEMLNGLDEVESICASVLAEHE
jgi:DNA-binding transcriptional MerR regulator